MRSTRSYIVTLAFGLGLAACGGGKNTSGAGGAGRAGTAGGAGGVAGATGAAGGGGRGGATGAAGSGGAAGAAGDCSGDMTVTLSGAFSGTRAVPTVAVSWSSSSDTSTVYASAQYGTPFQVSMSFTFAGAPSVATYTGTTPNLTCLISATDSANSSRGWIAAAGSPPGANQGTCSITFTAVTPTPNSPNQTPYCVHGSVSAVLPDASGNASAATVTLAASF